MKPFLSLLLLLLNLHCFTQSSNIISLNEILSSSETAEIEELMPLPMALKLIYPEAMMVSATEDKNETKSIGSQMNTLESIVSHLPSSSPSSSSSSKKNSTSEARHALDRLRRRLYLKRLLRSKIKKNQRKRQLPPTQFSVQKSKTRTVLVTQPPINKVRFRPTLKPKETPTVKTPFNNVPPKADETTIDHFDPKPDESIVVKTSSFTHFGPKPVNMITTNVPIINFVAKIPDSSSESHVFKIQQMLNSLVEEKTEEKKPNTVSTHITMPFPSTPASIPNVPTSIPENSDLTELDTKDYYYNDDENFHLPEHVQQEDYFYDNEEDNEKEQLINAIDIKKEVKSIMRAAICEAFSSQGFLGLSFCHHQNLGSHVSARSSLAKEAVPPPLRQPRNFYTPYPQFPAMYNPYSMYHQPQPQYPIYNPYPYYPGGYQQQHQHPYGYNYGGGHQPYPNYHSMKEATPQINSPSQEPTTYDQTESDTKKHNMMYPQNNHPLMYNHNQYPYMNSQSRFDYQMPSLPAMGFLGHMVHRQQRNIQMEQQKVRRQNMMGQNMPGQKNMQMKAGD